MENKQASGFKYPISISDAIANIKTSKFLQLAIQLKYVKKQPIKIVSHF